MAKFLTTAVLVVFCSGNQSLARLASLGRIHRLTRLLIGFESLLTREEVFWVVAWGFSFGCLAQQLGLGSVCRLRVCLCIDPVPGRIFMTSMERVCKAISRIWILAFTGLVILGHPNAQGTF